jgi:excisionase family DNA binding protein
MSIADHLDGLDHAISARELARLLGVHKLTIYRAVNSGVLPCFRIGSCVRFDPRVIAAWLRERAL